MKFFREIILRIRIRNQTFSGYERTIFLRGLRASFSILKSLAWSTNTCTVRIWNLSQDHRNIIKDYGDEVTVYAGYKTAGGVQAIFIGDTTAVTHLYDQPEIITILECGDGEKFLNQLRVSLSFAEKTPAKTIIRAIASQMGLALIEFADSQNLIYRQPFNFIGMGKEALDEVCSKLSLQWSVQNQGLQVIPINGTINQPTVQISEQTGMQGLPQRYTYRRLELYRPTSYNVSQSQTGPRIIPNPTTGYKVNVVLTPMILPGSKVDLTCKHLKINSPFRVDNIRHEGDTYGFLWQSNLELTELLAGATK